MSQPETKHKPNDMGRYILCSTARSFNGTKVDVGASVRKNHADPSLIHLFPNFKTIKMIPIIRIIENTIFQSFDNVLNDTERAALIYDMGLSKEYGTMDQSQIAAMMKEEGFKTSEGHDPRQQWISKKIVSAIGKMREAIGYETVKTKSPEKKGKAP